KRASRQSSVNASETRAARPDARHEPPALRPRPMPLVTRKPEPEGSIGGLEMTTFSKLAAAALAFIALAGAGPAAANAWGLPSTAYFIVDLNYCTPGGLTGPRPAPVGDVAVVYNEVLI